MTRSNYLRRQLLDNPVIKSCWFPFSLAKKVDKVRITEKAIGSTYIVAIKQSLLEIWLIIQIFPWLKLGLYAQGPESLLKFNCLPNQLYVRTQDGKR